MIDVRLFDYDVSDPHSPTESPVLFLKGSSPGIYELQNGAYVKLQVPSDAVARNPAGQKYRLTATGWEWVPLDPGEPVIPVFEHRDPVPTRVIEPVVFVEPPPAPPPNPISL
jgi:hypothetical protein